VFDGLYEFCQLSTGGSIGNDTTSVHNVCVNVNELLVMTDLLHQLFAFNVLTRLVGRRIQSVKCLRDELRRGFCLKQDVNSLTYGLPDATLNHLFSFY